MANETIYIKQKILAEDISLGINSEVQVRNGVRVTGEQVNAKHILYNNENSIWHKKSLNDIMTKLIESTGIVPN